jgi:hypothetical protein
MDGESCLISISLPIQSSWDLPAPPARIKVKTPQAGQSTKDRFAAELAHSNSSSLLSSANAVRSSTHCIYSLDQPLLECPSTPRSNTSSTRSDSSTDCWIAAVIPKYDSDSPNSSSSAWGACNQGDNSYSKAPAAWLDHGSCAEGQAPQDAQLFSKAGRVGGSAQAAPLVATPMQVSKHNGYRLK